MKIINVRQILSKIFMAVLKITRIYFYSILSNNHIVGNPKRIQPIHVVGCGSIICEDGVSVGYFPSPHFFSTYAYIEARGPSASILICKDTMINNNVSIVSEGAGIIIGSSCLIGCNVEIIDSDFHSLTVAERKNGNVPIPKKVCIGSNVFIGSNVKIMKGVSIGDGAVIANGSIVTKDIPEHVVAGGNPATTIKYLDKV